MTKNEIDQEFKKITAELRKDFPPDKPFPPDVVNRRTLLLFAQVHLSNILGAIMKKDKIAEKFQSELYNIVMSNYFNWFE